MTAAHRVRSARTAAARHARRGRRSPTTAQVQSLTRGLSILECLARTEGGLTLTDVGAARGSCRRRRRIDCWRRSRRWATCTRPATSASGTSACRRSPSARAFSPTATSSTQSHAYMRRLMEQSGETANLAILDGTEAVFIDQVQCRETMRTIVKLGSRVPLHASGVGKAIFASLPDEQIDAMLKVRGLPRITENTITSPETMWASVRVIRQRGWSFDDEEHLPGTRCVAAPIYDEHAEPLGAISLAGPVVAPARRAHPAARARRVAHRRGDHAQARRPLAAPVLSASAPAHGVPSPQRCVRALQRRGASAPARGQRGLRAASTARADRPSRAKSLQTSTMSQAGVERRVGARDDVARRVRAGHLEIVGEHQAVEAEAPAQDVADPRRARIRRAADRPPGRRRAPA